MNETQGVNSNVELTAMTQHFCSPECPDCFRRRVCRDGHDYTDAMQPSVYPVVGMVIAEPPLRLYCRRCGGTP